MQGIIPVWWLVLSLLLACQGGDKASLRKAPAPAKARPPTERPTAKMDGLSLEAPPKAVYGEWTEAVKQSGADWVAVIPYGYCRENGHKVYYDYPWQWWGEHPDGARKTIRQAQEAGFRVMVKPQVWFMGSWAGDFKVGPEKAQEWFATYQDYLLTFARMAEEESCPLLCIGTETDKMAVAYPEQWRQLIRAVRQVYSGQLTYAANWDQYQHIPFWPALDYIGVDAYFPLSDEAVPAVSALEKAWQPVRQKLHAFSQAHGKPILFTEYGYRSMEGAAGKQWLFQHEKQPVSNRAQKQALQALLKTFWQREWFAGGFLWKWRIRRNYQAENYRDDYTPQDKPAIGVLQRYYGKTGRF